MSEYLGEPDTAEFSYEQFHYIIDETIAQFAEKSSHAAPTGGISRKTFEHIAAEMKSAFPCNPELPAGKPVFNKQNVKALLVVLTDRCSNALVHWLRTSEPPS